MTDWQQPPDQPLSRIFFSALMSGPEPHLTAFALAFVAVGAVIFVLAFVGVWIGDSAQLGTTAATEISVISGGLGLMFGRIFAKATI